MAIDWKAYNGALDWVTDGEPENADAHERSQVAGIAAHAEEPPPEHDEMVRRLAEAGVDQEKLKALPPEKLAERYKMAEGYARRHAEDREEEHPEKDFGEFSDYMADEQMAIPPEKHEAMRAYACRMGEHYRKMMARLGEQVHAPEGEPPAVTNPVHKPTQFSEQQWKELVSKAAKEVGAHFGHELETMKKRYDAFAEASDRKAATEIVAAAVRLGQLPAAAADLTSPYNAVDRLVRAAAVKGTRKFAEKGKTVELTEFQIQEREIKALPHGRYSERVRSEGTPLDPTDAEQEVGKVKQHHRKFSEQFRKVGTTEEQLVAGFKAALKQGLAKTADEYLQTA